MIHPTYEYTDREAQKPQRHAVTDPHQTRSLTAAPLAPKVTSFTAAREPFPVRRNSGRETFRIYEPHAAPRLPHSNPLDSH